MIKKTLWPALVLAFAFSGTAASKPVNHNSRPGCRKTFTVPMVKRAVYWTYRGTRDVPRHDRRAVARIVRCERFPHSEKYVRGIEHRVIARWKHRRYEKNRYTPYGEWAIPSYIVYCESRGENLPPNSAGASGYYQIIPGTWAGYGGLAYGPAAYESSKHGQDVIATRIWDGGAGASQWDCA